jgi:hypothetical protein
MHIPYGWFSRHTTGMTHLKKNSSSKVGMPKRKDINRFCHWIWNHHVVTKSRWPLHHNTSDTPRYDVLFFWWPSYGSLCWDRFIASPAVNVANKIRYVMLLYKSPFLCLRTTLLPPEILLLLLLLLLLLTGGKQWQTTPKNLARMQPTRAIPVAWLRSGLCPDQPKGWIPIIIILLTAIDLSLGGSSPDTSTDKTNKNKFT